MKIVVLMGSPRKGNTFRACEEFREHLQKLCQVDFDYVWLGNVRVDPCRGCFTCFPHGEEKCPLRDDDVGVIEQKMLDADGVIFASPVYSANVSGQMKIFIDRLSYTGHRPRFFEKKAFVIVTTGAFGTGEVIKYLKNLAWAWGFEYAGSAGLITGNGDIPADRTNKNTRLLKQGAEKFADILLRTTPRRPGITDVVYFYGLRGVFSNLKTVSPADYQYWKKRGWLSPDANWFMDVPVNPVYRAIGKIAEFLTRRIFRNSPA